MSVLHQGVKRSIMHVSSLSISHSPLHYCCAVCAAADTLLFVSHTRCASSNTFMRALLTPLIAVDESKFTASISQPDSVYGYNYICRCRRPVRHSSYRLHSHGNPLCVYLHGQLQIYLYCRPQCRLVYGRVWRFTPVLTPGLAISID